MAYMTTDINDIAKRAFETNEKNGYNEYRQELEENGKKAAVKHLGNKGLITVSEETEAQDELRAGHEPYEIYFGDDMKPEGYLVEKVDTVIRVLGDISEVFDVHADELEGWDIAKLIKLKQDYNDRRKDTATSGHKAF